MTKGKNNMAFEKVATLDTDSTITIGGKDKKTGKSNPPSIEGYFLGTKALGPNKFNRSKTDYMHVFQTQDGNVGVWGKTHMDRQLLSVLPGTMTRVTYAGTKDVGKGNDMTCYLVEVDNENTIPVSFGANSPVDAPEESASSSYADDESDDEGEQEAQDETAPRRAAPPRAAAKPPSAAQQERVRSLLGGGKNRVN